MVASVVGAFATGVASSPARAANGGSALLGKSNSASLTTSVTTSAGTGLAATGPVGVSGKSSSTAAANAGVLGTAASVANYGVFSNGKLGTTGPLEMAALTITSYANPLATKAYLYVKTNGNVTELRFKVGTNDVLITSG